MGAPVPLEVLAVAAKVLPVEPGLAGKNIGGR
jgi:hypothetical protein